MRVYTREDVYMSACEHMWGAFLGEYMYDDLDKREASGAGVQCRHTHMNRWVLMRISVCAGGPRSFILQTLTKHLQCARHLCWGWEVRREKMCSCLWELIVSWGDRQLNAGMWGTVW